MKKIIGVEIDEIIRAKFQEFDKYYANEFGEDLADAGEFTLDYRNKFTWKDTDEIINYLNEDLPENISPLEYQVDPKTGEAPVDHMAFRKRVEKKTAEEVFKRFLYQDYLLEIHGHAQKIYRDVDIHVEAFYRKYKDQFDIRVINKENWFTIPPTLFFLSKVRPRFKTFHFVENENEPWEIADIIITTDPRVIKAKPHNLLYKKAVMLKRPYNVNIETQEIVDEEIEKKVDLAVLNIHDLTDNEEFEKLIGYVKPEEENSKEVE